MRHDRLRARLDAGEPAMDTGLPSRRLTWPTPAAPTGDLLTGEARQ
ncbi:MAG: hypothetical protein AB7F22_26730 [Reyranella sp.]